MCDQQKLRPACAYAKSVQSLCQSLEYSMIVKLLTESHLEFLSLKEEAQTCLIYTCQNAILLEISCIGLYVIKCNGCKELYIGETGDKLRTRRTIHAQQKRDPSTRQIPLSEHIDNCSRSIPKFKCFLSFKCTQKVFLPG